MKGRLITICTITKYKESNDENRVIKFIFRTEEQCFHCTELKKFLWLQFLKNYQITTAFRI